MHSTIVNETETQTSYALQYRQRGILTSESQAFRGVARSSGNPTVLSTTLSVQDMPCPKIVRSRKIMFHTAIVVLVYSSADLIVFGD